MPILSVYDKPISGVSDHVRAQQDGQGGGKRDQSFVGCYGLCQGVWWCVVRVVVWLRAGCAVGQCYAAGSWLVGHLEAGWRAWAAGRATAGVSGVREL